MHSRIPGLLLTQYCAENSQQLAHRSDDGDLARLASLTQALIEGANGRIAPRGRQGRHVQHAAYIPPAAGDMPGFVLCAALIGIRRNAHNGRRFLAIDGPQFGQAEQQVQCGDRADAGHAVEQLPFPAHLVGALRLVVAFLLKRTDLLIQPINMLLDARTEVRRGSRQPIDLSRPHLNHLLPPDQQVAQGCALLVRRLVVRRAHPFGKAGEQPGIQAVGRRLASFRVRQGAHAAWLHPRRRHASLEQLGEHHALQPAGRLQHNQGRLQALESRDQELDTFVGRRYRLAWRVRVGAKRPIQRLFGDINADKERLTGSPTQNLLRKTAPALLAYAGLRAQITVRLGRVEGHGYPTLRGDLVNLAQNGIPCPVRLY
jgi:hypothetical protein